jgi:ABC-2 type transport system permease protein
MRGLIAVFHKELEDYFTSWRFVILFALVFGVGILAIYMDAQYIRQEVVGARHVFLLLYTTAGQSMPIFTAFVAFFMPIVGIALGFDAMNSEKNRGTMSRLLSQPIYRDSVINGKFLAGVATIGIMLTSMVILVGAMGLAMIGVPPGSEEIIRLMVFLIIGILYGAFWLGVSILFSIIFLRTSTSALASIAIWILFLFMFLFPFFVQSEQAELSLLVMRVSPIMVFWQVLTILLLPNARTIGQMLQGGVVPQSALSLDQSLLTITPHLVSLILLTVICFAISYTKFMREEIRA